MRTCRTRASGAQRRLWWRKGVSTFQQELRLPGYSTDRCCTVCGAYHFSSTPCMRMLPTFSCLLASDILAWAALSQPQSCFGLSTRNDVSSLWLRGAMAPCSFTIWLFCAVSASHTPWSAQTLHPPFAPVSPRLLLCWSLSHSLPPILSCSLSCAPLSLSLLSVAPLSSFPTASYSLSLSLSPSRPKRGVRVVRCISIPPGVRTILYRTEEVWCIHWATKIGYLHHVLLSFFPTPPCVSSPVMRIFFRMGVCSAACRGTAQRPRVPGPPA